MGAQPPETIGLLTTKVISQSQSTFNQEQVKSASKGLATAGII